MRPFQLNTPRLLLRPFAPTATDANAVYEACQDADIQRWTTVPSPYERHHALVYVEHVCPRGWEEETMCSWALCLPASSSGHASGSGSSETLVGSLALMGREHVIRSYPTRAHAQAAAAAQGEGQDGDAPEGVIVVGGGAHDAASHTWEIGYWISAPHRGKGLLREAHSAVLRWALDSDVSDTSRPDSASSPPSAPFLEPPRPRPPPSLQRIAWRAEAGNTPSLRAILPLGFQRGPTFEHVVFVPGRPPLERLWTAEVTRETLRRVGA